MSDPYGPSSHGPSDRRSGYDGPSHSYESRPARHGSPDSEDGLPIRRVSADPWAGVEGSYGSVGSAAPGSARVSGHSPDADYQQAGYSPGAGHGQASRAREGDYAQANYPPDAGYGQAPDSFGPDGRPGGMRRGGRSSRLVMGGAAAAVVLVLVAAAAIFELHGRGGSSPNTSDAALNQGAGVPAAVASGAAPAAADPSAAASPSAAKPSPGKSAAKSSTAKGTSTKPAASSSGVPAPPTGFTLTYSDAFSGASGTGLSTSKYRYDTAPGSSFGTGEIETTTSSTKNVFHDGNGHLVIRALHTGSDPGSGWTSGRFETQSDSFGAAKGGKVRMQASIQQPDVTRSNGAGYWPAFWMLGNGLRNGGSWPKIGEIDILEDINGRSSVFGTLHCGVNPGGPCNESSGLGSGEKTCAGCQTGFHTYAVEIDRSSSPEKIRWFLDGNNYFTVTQDRVDASTWSNAVDHPFFIIFDLAMGGGFPGAFGGGPNNNTVSGGEMKIDYVAVYNSK